MEQELRRMFESKEAEMAVPDSLPLELRRRVGRQRIVIGGLVVLSTVGLALGGFALGSTALTDAAPVVLPAEEGKGVEPMRNGRILHAEPEDMYWQGSTAPPAPGGDQTYHWDAFDQDTGSFLYVRQAQERTYWVIGEDGPPVAEFDCPTSSGCGGFGIESFGPGPDEITVPSQDLKDSEAVRVIGFDGTARETLDIWTATESADHTLSDIEWSPDGTRLAVSTEPERPCDRDDDACEGRVWIFERGGTGGRLVYSEPAQKYQSLRDLAWSPDGDRLATMVATANCNFPVDAPPRVVVLDLAPGEAVSAETLFTIEDDGRRGACILPHHIRLEWPFAWSPDGTRIAVSSADGIAEISSETGEVLVRHPTTALEGPMAWLPEG